MSDLLIVRGWLHRVRLRKLLLIFGLSAAHEGNIDYTSVRRIVNDIPVENRVFLILSDMDVTGIVSDNNIYRYKIIKEEESTLQLTLEGLVKKELSFLTPYSKYSHCPNHVWYRKLMRS